MGAGGEGRRGEGGKRVGGGGVSGIEREPEI